MPVGNDSGLRCVAARTIEIEQVERMFGVDGGSGKRSSGDDGGGECEIAQDGFHGGSFPGGRAPGAVLRTV